MSKSRNILVAIVATLIFLTLPLYMLNSLGSLYAQGESVIGRDSFANFMSERYRVSKLSTDSAEFYFTRSAEYFLSRQDTSNYLLSLSNLADIQNRRGTYDLSFETINRALPYAVNHRDKLPLVELNSKLMTLYQIYGDDSMALECAIENLALISKYALEDGISEKVRERRANYRQSSCLSLASQAIEMGKLALAKSYLDSCYILSPNDERQYYVDAFYAKYYLLRGELRRALRSLDGVIPYMKERRSGFQASVYRFYGEIYEAMNRRDSAIYYYQRVVGAIDSLEVSLAGKPEILHRLALLHEDRGESRAAYNCMKSAKELTDSLFTSQSNQNKRLFEIKNLYRERLEKEQATTLRQREILESSRRNRLLLIGLIIFITVAFLVTIICIRLQVKVRDISKEKVVDEAVIELKNRELAANALQFIDRENLITEIVDLVEGESPELKRKIDRTLHQNSKQMWDEFNLRFTQTNGKFYDALLLKHPSLTAGDLKMCALIRLNFSSKELSRLLGISTGSVLVSRSRLRKRLDLEHGDNLSDYLSKIE